jgi:hypothetical protein
MFIDAFHPKRFGSPGRRNRQRRKRRAGRAGGRGEGEEETIHPYYTAL